MGAHNSHQSHLISAVGSGPHKNQHSQKRTREMTETILNISAMPQFCETRCMSVIYGRSKALQIVFQNLCLPYLLILVNDVRRFRVKLIIRVSVNLSLITKKWIIMIQWCYKPMFIHKLLRPERCDCAVNYTRNHTQRLIKIALMSSYSTHKRLDTNSPEHIHLTNNFPRWGEAAE